MHAQWMQTESDDVTNNLMNDSISLGKGTSESIKRQRMIVPNIHDDSI